MFRELRSKNKQLPQEECIELLKSEMRGVLSLLGDDDYPYGLPINHYYCESDGKLYFHSGMEGYKVDALRAHDKASFCVYDKGFRREGEWALNIRSVIVFGRIEIVKDHAKALDFCRELCRKFGQDEAAAEDEIRRSGDKTLCFTLTPEHMTGKLVHEE